MDFSHLVHVQSALQHSHKVLIESEELLLIHCTVSNVYIAECTRGLEKKFAEMLMTFPVVRVETSNERLQQLLIPYFKHSYKCEQVEFLAGFQLDSKLELIHPEDIEFAAETYGMPEYINQLAQRNRLFGYYADGKFVGYVAFHIDETVGGLYVKPEFRRQGYGEKIMSAAVSLYQKKNSKSVCYAQILSDNTSSINLHKKMECRFTEPVYWAYNEEFLY